MSKFLNFALRDFFCNLARKRNCARCRRKEGKIEISTPERESRVEKYISKVLCQISWPISHNTKAYFLLLFLERM